VGQWIVGVISFQKIFGLCGLRGHKVEIRWDVTIVDNGQRTECEDRAILKQNSQYSKHCVLWMFFLFLTHVFVKFY